MRGDELLKKSKESHPKGRKYNPNSFFRSRNGSCQSKARI